MKKQPLISICIPAYNRPHLLEKLIIHIEAILNEKTKELVEIVIADDSTTSPSSEIILPYIEKFWNIFYHRNKNNLGWVNTVTISKYATWKYLFLVADDDWITDFSLDYLIEILEDSEFDILFHKPFFSENIDVSIVKSPNTFSKFQGINEFLTHLLHHERQYKELISYFSFYSSVVVKSTYRAEAIINIDFENLKSNSFPHEMMNYFNLTDKVIIIPDSTFVVGRLLNESYPSSTILIDHLKQIMQYIEWHNMLSDKPHWNKIKDICVSGRSRTIRMGILLKKLHIDYKNNWLLKKLYFIYKRFFQ